MSEVTLPVEDQPLDSGVDERIRALIGKRQVMAARTLLEEKGDGLASKERTELATELDRICAEADGLYRLALDFEKKRSLEQARNTYQQLAYLVQDYPDVDAALARVNDAILLVRAVAHRKKRRRRKPASQEFGGAGMAARRDGFPWLKAGLPLLLVTIVVAVALGFYLQPEFRDRVLQQLGVGQKKVATRKIPGPPRPSTTGSSGHVDDTAGPKKFAEPSRNQLENLDFRSVIKEGLRAPTTEPGRTEDNSPQVAPQSLDHPSGPDDHPVRKEQAAAGMDNKDTSAPSVQAGSGEKETAPPVQSVQDGADQLPDESGASLVEPQLQEEAAEHTGEAAGKVPVSEEERPSPETPEQASGTESPGLAQEARPATVDEVKPISAAPEEEQQESSQQAAAASPDGQTYVVQPGDSLFLIAQKLYGDGLRWSIIARANQQVLQDNVDYLPTGTKLVIPPLPAIQASTPGIIGLSQDGTTYRVQSGDTLASIAQKLYGRAAMWEKLYTLNKDRITDPEKLEVGMELLVWHPEEKGQGTNQTPMRQRTETTAGEQPPQDSSNWRQDDEDRLSFWGGDQDLYSDGE